MMITRHIWRPSQTFWMKLSTLVCRPHHLNLTVTSLYAHMCGQSDLASACSGDKGNSAQSHLQDGATCCCSAARSAPSTRDSEALGPSWQSGTKKDPLQVCSPAKSKKHMERSKSCRQEPQREKHLMLRSYQNHVLFNSTSTSVTDIVAFYLFYLHFFVCLTTHEWAEQRAAAAPLTLEWCVVICSNNLNPGSNRPYTTISNPWTWGLLCRFNPIGCAGGESTAATWTRWTFRLSLGQDADPLKSLQCRH